MPEFYAEKSVLVTGFTGLLGKLVVEKLLWSCPNINKIYILIRSKRDLSPSERLKKITDLLVSYGTIYRPLAVNTSVNFKIIFFFQLTKKKFQFLIRRLSTELEKRIPESSSQN